MQQLIRTKWVRQWALAAACLPLVLLAGCPQNQTAAPGKVPVQTTAPTIAKPANTSPDATAAPKTTQTAEEAARAYKSQQLINRVEQIYRSGVDSYRSGHLDAARQDFDSAVDMMLTSGMDLNPVT